MKLIVNYYKDSNPVRQAELDECLQLNINNSNIDKIYLLVDDENFLSYSNLRKIIPIRVYKRPTFTELFEVANMLGGIKIIANADIYFDETLEKAKQIKEDEVYALSRWDRINSVTKLYSHRDSQDAWIFNDKINIKVNYGLGQPGCDNAIAYEFNKAGFNITNPSISIKAIHLHQSNIKSYCDELGNLKPGIMRVIEPYLRVTPIEL